MENLNIYISVFIAIGYIFYNQSGSSNPKMKYYNKLLTLKPFLFNLSLTSGIVLFGIWRVKHYDTREVLYFAPFIYLLLLRIFNWLSILINKRNIILATRWDSPPKGKDGINWFDRLLAFLLLFIPIVICGLIMNKLNFGVLMVGKMK